MDVPANPEFRQQLIAKALDSVKAASKARGWFDQYEDDHPLKTQANDEVTRSFLEDAIRTAMDYGYPIEAVAGAASISIDEANVIANGPAAA